MSAKLRQAHKDYGCEIRDPCGTIWEHAAKLEKENAELKSCVELLRGAIRHQVDGDWLKAIGFVESSDRDYVLGGWLVITCESGKWLAYSAKQSHWHCLCVVDTREDVTRLVKAMKLGEKINQ
jgi:hypothetical protein